MLVRGQRPDGQRVDLVADQFAERPVNELVSGKRPLAGEISGYDERFEVRIVVAGYGRRCAFEAGFDQSRNILRIHGSGTAYRLVQGV